MSLERTGPAHLSDHQYESLLDAAETYREALVIRLCGEVGLRPTELSRLTVDSIDQVRTDPPRYLLDVPAGDDQPDRPAYLPTRVERELRRYVRSNGLAGTDRVFSVTPRRLQMLVSAVADRAGTRLDDPALSAVSTSDLRRYFARSALVDHDINPRAVKTAGGWQSFEALESYLAEPTGDELVDAFAPVERSPDRGPRAGPDSAPDHERVVQSLLAATDRCALVRLDEEGYVDRWDRSSASTFGYRAGTVVGTHVSTFFPDEAVERGVPERTLSTADAEAVFEDELSLVRSDGSSFEASVTCLSLADVPGGNGGYALLVTDVSAVRERHAETDTDRETLDRRYGVACCHRTLTRSLLSATDHEDVETETCASLVDGDAYAFAWIDRTTLADGRRNWRTASGIEPGSVETLVPDKWHEEPTTLGDMPQVQVVDGVTASGDVPTTDESADGDGEADGRFEGSLARVALSYGDTVYGALTVATSHSAAFDEDERTWLETIGRQVGYAIAAVRRRNLLLSDHVLELEFRCRDDGSFFVECARELDCRFELDSLVPISESTQLYYVTLDGASPAAVFDRAEDDPGIIDCRLIETDESGWRVEFVVEGSSPTLTLTEYGVTALEATIEDGVATITGECAGDTDLRTIVTGLRSAFPDSELVGKRETERTVQTAQEFREGLEDRLTDRQEVSLRAAYFGGYYDWPRESTAEEVADAMGISSPTLHNHLRKGQHELLQTFFDDPDDA